MKEIYITVNCYTLLFEVNVLLELIACSIHTYKTEICSHLVFYSFCSGR